MSLLTLLSIARSALLTQQRAMSVSAQNIANASTPGYSRQRLNLVAATPLLTPLGALGRGVADAGISRVRDRVLDAAYRRESGLLADATARQTVLEQVEGAFGEPSDIGVAASLDGLFQSFADLVNDPSNPTSRELVRQAATRFVQQVHQLDANLTQVTRDAVVRLQDQVSQANSIAQHLGELNRQILAAGPGGAPDLEDQRDLLVDQLSALAPVQVQTRADGTIGVVMDGVTLVDGVQVDQLTVQALPGGAYSVGTQSGATGLDLSGGSIGAMTTLLSSTLADVRSQLDTFVGTLVSQVNTLHRQGYTLAGQTQTDFFDPAGVTASTLALAPGILASGDNIAAAGTNAAGDGANALLLAGLKEDALPALNGRSLRQYYADIAAGVGIGVRNAGDDVNIHQALLDQADAQRSAVSGVSLDEEMVMLISQQEAYSAAERIVKMADDALQMLLQIV